MILLGCIIGNYKTFNGGPPRESCPPHPGLCVQPAHYVFLEKVAVKDSGTQRSSCAHLHIFIPTPGASFRKPCGNAKYALAHAPSTLNCCMSNKRSPIMRSVIYLSPLVIVALRSLTNLTVLLNLYHWPIFKISYAKLLGPWLSLSLLHVFILNTAIVFSA